jgi:hypothetical protein
MSPVPRLTFIHSGTGVAYVNIARGSTEVKTLQTWPGKEVEAKVPTIVVYDQSHPTGPPTSWGFRSEAESERGADRIVAQWFKVDFPQGGDPYRYYVDYLRQLYNHLQSEFHPQLLNGKQWHQAKVDFIFSVPAIWRTDDVHKFKEAIGRAGFGTVPGHSLKVDLTEPQAVAVHAAMKESKIFNVKSPRKTLLYKTDATVGRGHHSSRGCWRRNRGMFFYRFYTQLC